MNETEVKILPAVTILAIIVFGIFSFVLANASEITPDNIVKLVNEERTANGLNPLKMNPKLQSAAIFKSNDMIYRNYFDHYAFGQTPWMFIIRAGYDYSVAGENLAKGYSTSEGVVNAWINSPSHRANILNPDFQDIGVGVVRGAFTADGQTVETTMTTELFATPKSKIAVFFERISNTIFSIF